MWFPRTAAVTLLAVTFLPFGPHPRAGHELDHAVRVLTATAVPLFSPRAAAREPADEGVVCSAVSVAPGIYLTAAHCLPEPDEGAFDLHIGNSLADPVFVDGGHDLMVLAAPQERREAIKLADDVQHAGDLVVLYGFPGGYSIPILFSARITHPGLKLEDGQMAQLFDHPVMPGMSGGPIVDARGRLVGIIQRTSAVMSLGARLEEIRATVAPWVR